MTKEHATRLGAHAEDLAADYLHKQGLTLLKHNYRCRGGEIDLIMQDKNTIVFIEVKSRSPSSYSTPLESVTYQKQQKIIHAAKHFIQANRIKANTLLRFDVVGIVQTTDKDAKINWIQNAFVGT